MKKRLDLILVERGLAKSREEAQGFILAGEVWQGEKRLEKPGTQYPLDIAIEIKHSQAPFVSRAGQKLEHFVATHRIELQGKVCLDIGASTGGFTDCVLKRGAKHVFAVDVGYGQLDFRLRSHAKITNIERMNARYLTFKDLETANQLAGEIEFVIIDVSFISLSKIIPVIRQEVPSAKEWIFLFKPQFEVGKNYIGKGGIVRSEEAVQESLRSMQEFLTAHCKLKKMAGPDSSIIAGKKSGNLEYLLYYTSR